MVLVGAWAGGCGGHLCDHGGLAYGPPLQRVEGLLRVGRVLEESEGHGPGARARHEVHRDVARQLADQIKDHRVGRACTQGVRASACACVLGRGAAGDEIGPPGVDSGPGAGSSDDDYDDDAAVGSHAVENITASSVSAPAPDLPSLLAGFLACVLAPGYELVSAPDLPGLLAAVLARFGRPRAWHQRGSRDDPERSF